MHHRKTILLAWVAWVLALVPAWGGVPNLRGRETYVPGEILVSLKNGTSAADRAKALAAAGTPGAVGASGLFKVRLKAGLDVPSALARMRGDPAVLYAQPNYRYYAMGNTCTLPGDLYSASFATTETWPFRKIRMDEAVTLFDAWAACPPGGNPSSPVTVAVLDSGVSRFQPDLKLEPPIGYNAIAATGEQDPSCTGCGYSSGPSYTDTAGCTASMDDYGHGTFVAGIIGAGWDTINTETASSYHTVCSGSGGATPYAGQSTSGVAGVAPGAVLMAVKVLDCTGSGTTDSIVAGTDYAVSHGARVLNFSLGSSPAGGIDPAEQAALDNALAHNCVIVASAGNESYNGQLAALDYPAAYPPVIAVGATGPDDSVASYSNGGPGLDLVAPGGTAAAFTGDAAADSADKVFSSFLSPLPLAAVTECGFEPLYTDPNFGAAAGTSAAAPFVSAAAALVLSAYPGLTGTQVSQAIINNADSLNGNKGWDPATGYGRLDVYQALLNAGTGGGQVSGYVKTFNSPNPFYPDVTGTTNITLALGQPEPVELTIYDSSGEVVLHRNYQALELDQNPSNPQFKSYYVSWDGRNGAGQPAKTGIYFYSVKTDGKTGRNKIALIRGAK